MAITREHPVLTVGQPREEQGLVQLSMRISDGSIGSQLDTAPSTSFPLGFLKFIAHPTSLRSVAHQGLPFSDHYTSWVCTEMLIYHHVSSAGLCEPAWVRCTPLGKPGISSQREEMLHPPAGLCESVWSSFSSRSLRSKSRVCDCAGQRVG